MINFWFKMNDIDLHCDSKVAKLKIIMLALRERAYQNKFLELGADK